MDNDHSGNDGDQEHDEDVFQIPACQEEQQHADDEHRAAALMSGWRKIKPPKKPRITLIG